MIEKYAILRNNEQFFSKDIYIPEAREIEYSIRGLYKLDGCERLIPKDDIWKICASQVEADKLIEQATKIIKEYTEKAADDCCNIGRELESKLKALIG